MSQYKTFFLRNQRIKNNCLEFIKELPTDDKKTVGGKNSANDTLTRAELKAARTTKRYIQTVRI